MTPPYTAPHEPATSIPTTPSQKLAAALAEECPERRIAETLSDCLSATVMNRAGAVEPAWSVRLQAVALVLDHRYGKPVQRQEVVTVAVDADSSGMRERLAKSPALRKALKEMLAESGEKAIDV
jgi:hypothetical protein